MTRIAVQRAYQPSGDPTRRVGQVRSNTSGTPFSGTLSLPDAPLPFRSDAFFSHAQGKGSGSSCIRCRCRLQEAITEKQTMQGQEQKTMNSTGCKLCRAPIAAGSAMQCHPACLTFACPGCVATNKETYNLINLKNHVFDYHCAQCITSSFEATAQARPKILERHTAPVL